ncbi:MAG: hypothetical protein HY898_07805 [Deltaproteobacteria bacterium]|nr:hypothetical protein [Deltaproteobacteria bacterium]
MKAPRPPVILVAPITLTVQIDPAQLAQLLDLLAALAQPSETPPPPCESVTPATVDRLHAGMRFVQQGGVRAQHRKAPKPYPAKGHPGDARQGARLLSGQLTDGRSVAVGRGCHSLRLRKDRDRQHAWRAIERIAPLLASERPSSLPLYACLRLLTTLMTVTSENLLQLLAWVWSLLG